MINKLSLHNPREAEYIPLNDSTKYFYSTELGLIAGLLCAGHELKSIDKEKSGQCTMIIVRTPRTERTIKAYWSNNLKVDAQAMHTQIKRLKAGIRNTREL